MPSRALLRCSSVAALLLAAAPLRAGLIEYVQKPDDSFVWKLKDKKETSQGIIYDLQMTSQTWQGIKWEHRLQVYQPAGTTPTETMLLYNTGGGPSANSQLLALELAKRIGSPIAFLYDIPNQPLFGNKREDALIAETFCRFLEGQGKDESWPLLFPMAKSVVRSMDALQAFSAEVWKKPIQSFIITGGSKRGWTSWLTGASDRRVKAVAPLVIDTLNMVPQMEHQLKSFGKYSEMIRDYTERRLVPIPEGEAAKKLWQMVDPYFYRDRLTMPKMIINGANDPYWTVDALNLYWNDLNGDKSVLIVPNAGHDLREQKGGAKEMIPLRAVNSLSAFAKHMITNKPWPKVLWEHSDEQKQVCLNIKTTSPPKAARLWVAESTTRDFRKSSWKEIPAKVNDDKWCGIVAPPGKGCLALYGEVDFEVDGQKFSLSTQVRVCEAK